MSLRIPGARSDEQDKADNSEAAAEDLAAPLTLLLEQQQRQPRDVMLRLELLDAEGLAGMGGDADVTRRAFYCAVLSVSPLGAEVLAPVVHASPYALWRRRWDHRMEDYPWGLRNLSLRVEVVRVFETAEPGTSRGMTVMGRAEISLPLRVGERKGGRFDLVRCERGKCTIQGTVSLALELLPLPLDEINECIQTTKKRNTSC